MSEQTIIDSLEFAEKSRAIHGIIPLLELPRVRELLQDPAGALEYWLAGKRNIHGEAELELRLEARLMLVCQRCLGPMEYTLDTRTRFVVVASEDDMPAPEDEDFDVEYLAADARMDVLALIEDEVLLDLPHSLAHDDVNCNRTVAAATEQKESPFKVLQGLKLNK